jgi:predicted nucleotidyltransferase
VNIINIYNKTNWKILEAVKYDRLNLRDIARKLDMSPAAIHNNLRILGGYNLISIEKEKNQHLVIPNTDNFYYRSIMSVMNYRKIRDCKAFRALEKLGVIGMYGSFAAGTDEKSSDIDMVIFTEAGEIEVRAAANKLSQQMNKEINLLMLNRRKLDNLKKNDYEFYMRLKLQSITFNGDIFA